jgi:hypothetical protein
VDGPHGGHPTCLLVTTLANNLYIGKSCMLHIHMVVKLNLDPTYALNSSTPLHNIWSSLMKSYKYTFTLLYMHNSFPRMINDNMKNTFLSPTMVANYN